MSADARDEVLRALYRDATSELPRAEADAAVLRMARQAVADTPSRSTRWSPRLALAATVVLAVGLVTRVQLDAPDLQPATAPAKATPAAGAEPAVTGPATAPKADAPRAAIVAQASRQRQPGDDVASPARPAVSKLREQAGTPERQDTGDAAAKENASAREKKTELAGPQPAASGTVGTVGAVTESASRRNGSDLKKDRDPAGDRRTLARSETRSAESVQLERRSALSKHTSMTRSGESSTLRATIVALWTSENLGIVEVGYAARAVKRSIQVRGLRITRFSNRGKERAAPGWPRCCSKRKIARVRKSDRF